MTTNEAKARLSNAHVYPWQLTPEEHAAMFRGDTILINAKKKLIEKLESEIADKQKAIDIIKGL